MNTKYLAFSLALFAVIAATPHAFAANPYYGGYAKTATIEQSSQIWGYTDFQSSSAPAYYTGGVISTSGVFTNGTSSRIMYQDPITLNPSLSVTGDPQVWILGGTSPSWQSSTPLGTHGSGLSNVDYVYTTFYWNGARTQVTFYYEPHYNDGTSGSSVVTYSKSSVPSDKSDNFGVGYKDFISGSTTYRVKYLQFGAESGDVASGWNIKQYSMGYVKTSGSLVNLSSINSFTSPYISTDALNHSWIMYKLTGSTLSLNAIGKAQYNVNADYAHEGGGVPAGTVYWFRGTFLTPGTQLWP